jgi:hypothetical protein
MNEPLLKAAGFNSLMRVLQEMVTPEAHARFVSLLPDATRALVVDPPLAISWLPLEHAAPVYEVAYESLFARDDEAMRRLGRTQLRNDMTGIYRLLLRATTPAFVAAHVGKIYGTYTRNCGTLRPEVQSANELALLMDGRPFSSRPFCSYMCGSILGVLELTGVRSLSVRMTELPTFPARCSFSATWA